MKKVIICTALILSIISDVYAQSVQFDGKTTGQVIKNTASIVSKESITENYVSDSEKSQRETSMAMTSIQGSLTLLNTALKNAKAFRRDSKNLIEIGNLSKEITKELVNVAVEIRKNPKTTIASTKTLQNLSLEMYGNLQYCYSIVTNGEVALTGVKKNQNDGHNLLDAKDRLDMTNRIIINLRRIHNILIQIKYQQMYITKWSNILHEAAPFDFAKYSVGKDIATDIIKKFK